MVGPDDIQGVAPTTVETLETDEALADRVRACAEADQPIVDYGRFHQGLGHPPPAQHVQLRPAGGIVEHYVPDMTVTVRAGATLAEVQQALGEAKQWLPVDGADLRMTIGEAVAHNTYGPLRVGFGGWRDLLLGMTYTNAAGETITVGGRTVKNVAGYDVTRFMVGSLNTLGLISQCTLRTWAVSPQVTTVEAGQVEAADLDAHVTALLTSDAAPDAMELVAETGEAVGTMHLSYFGKPAACHARTSALGDWCKTAGIGEPSITTGEPDEDHATRARRWNWQPEATGLVKVVTRSGVAGQALETICADLDAPLRQATRINALPSLGAVWLGGPWTIDQANLIDRAVDRAIREAGTGFRVWLRRPSDTDRLSPFSPKPTDAAIQRKLKRAMDEKNLLNPGRLYDIK